VIQRFLRTDAFLPSPQKFSKVHVIHEKLSMHISKYVTGVRNTNALQSMTLNITKDCEYKKRC
jgi:hypothetical protein